jgi:hypothetical protein
MVTLQSHILSLRALHTTSRSLHIISHRLSQAAPLCCYLNEAWLRVCYLDHTLNGTKLRARTNERSIKFRCRRHGLEVDKYQSENPQSKKMSFENMKTWEKQVAFEIFPKEGACASKPVGFLNRKRWRGMHHTPPPQQVNEDDHWTGVSRFAKELLLPLALLSPLSPFHHCRLVTAVSHHCHHCHYGHHGHHCVTAVSSLWPLSPLPAPSRFHHCHHCQHCHHGPLATAKWWQWCQWCQR